MSPRCEPLVSRKWSSSTTSEIQRPYLSKEDEALYRAQEKLEKRLRRWAGRDAWRRRLVRPGAWIFAAIAVVGTVAAGLQFADFPATWWGEENPTPVDRAVTVIGALAIVAAGVLATAYARVVEGRARDRRLEELARSIAREVRNLSNVDADLISVHVWQLRDPRLWLVPRFLRNRPHFLSKRHSSSKQSSESFAEQRPEGEEEPNAPSSEQPRDEKEQPPKEGPARDSASPALSRWSAPHLVRRAAHVPERTEHEGFVFTPGVGVVGRCWDRRREVVEDLTDILKDATDAATYYRRWSYEERYRLSFANVWNTRQFWAIWAYPIFVGAAGAEYFGGCVSVDIQCPGRAAKLREVADNRSPELDSLLRDCAALLRREVPVA